MKKTNRINANFEKVSLNQFNENYNFNKGIASNDIIESDYIHLRIPERKTSGSAGYDVIYPYSTSVILKSGDSIIIPTGIKAFMPEGFVLKAYPRSSYGFKYHVMLANTIGIIDQDYYNNESNEGHIFIKLVNNGDKDLIINQGDAFAQMIFEQYFITIDDNVSDIREGGIGSTSKNK